MNIKRWYITGTLALVLGTGCASSERMMRMGADHSAYHKPEESRIAGFKRADKSLDASDIARNLAYDPALVNLWPFFMNSSRYTSVLWPMIDWDAYGVAIRPFFNQEGNEYSVLFPFAAWNPVAKDGWCGPVYWNQNHYGFVPLFHTPRKPGLHYYGPFWMNTEQEFAKHSGTAAQVALPKSWGVFPLAWFHLGHENQGSILGPLWWDSTGFGVFPLMSWTTDFRFFGPLFWRTGRFCGFFPLAAFNLEEGPSELKSYVFPLYYYGTGAFYSPIFCRVTGKEGSGTYRFLSSFQHFRAQARGRTFSKSDKHTMNSLLLAYWGNTVYPWKGRDGSSGEETKRYFGLAPLFEYSQMGEYKSFQTLFGVLSSMTKDSEYSSAHVLGPFGFLYSNDANSQPNAKKRNYFCSLLLFHRGRKESVKYPEVSNLIQFDLPNYENDDELSEQKRTDQRRRLATRMVSAGIIEPLPRNKAEAQVLAERLRKECGTNVKETYSAILPFYYEESDTAGEQLLVLPLLLSWFERTPHYRNDVIGSPLVYQYTSYLAGPWWFRGFSWRWRVHPFTSDPTATDLGSEYEVDVNSYQYERTRYAVFGESSRHAFRYWNEGTPDELKSFDPSFFRGTDSEFIQKYNLPCSSLDNPMELEKLSRYLMDHYTHTRSLTSTSYLGKLGFESVEADNGDYRFWLGAGLLAKQEKVGSANDLHVLGYLYRYQKRGDAERRFIFPFVTTQKEPGRSQWSFGWRLLNIEKSGGSTRGHIFFIPFGKSPDSTPETTPSA